jgi:uncharacterized protein (DUF1501 family)
MTYSRRQFLRTGTQALGGTLAASMLQPSISVGQSASGSGKNVIIINLFGGMDGLTAFPFVEGSHVNLINQRLRPTLAVPRDQILTPFAQSGSAQKIGVHATLAPLVNVAKNNLAIIHRYGIPGDPGRSHDTCQVIMSLGGAGTSGQGNMSGYLARLMDRKDWDSMQYWAFVSENPSDTNTRKKAPTSVDSLAALQPEPMWGENPREFQFAESLSRTLVESSTARDALDGKYLSTAKTTYRTVDLVRNDLVAQVVGKNSVGDYDNSPFGELMRDTAKLLKAKKTRPSLGLSGKDTLILAGQGGYDTHSDQNNPNAEEKSLPLLLTTLGKNLAVLYRDLKVFGMLNDTVILAYSEFGRTNAENGTRGKPTVGTDHGHGNTTFMCGGPVRAGVYGAPPTAEELLDTNYNALRPAIDYRDMLGEVIAWLGVSPQEIFTDPSYRRKPLGIVV